MRGNIYRDLIKPAIEGKRTNDSKKRGFITFSNMERNLVRLVASTTRTDKLFKEVRKGNLVLRKMVIA
mgnify:CR=1 FL=1